MRRALIAAVAAAVLALAGCGGGGGSGGGGGKPSGPPLTKAQYQVKLEQIAKDVSTGIGSTTSSSKKKISKADVDKFAKALHSFADELGKVNPPAGIKDLHLQLVGAMNDLGDEFPDIADSLNNTKDPSAAITALFGAEGVQELVKLGTAFKAKGYNLNLNG